MNTENKTLSRYINDAKNIVVFTGAGVSTESGIPDFRSTSGLYMTEEFNGYKPETLLTRKMFRQNPALVLRFYKQRLMKLVDKEPNRSHIALKKLEDMGKLKWVITQNIDNLHKKCGTKNVLELHGNGTKFKCAGECGELYTYEEFSQMLESKDLPKCKCEAFYIRPDVVMFDEWLNDETFDKAYWASKECDLFIVIGSSLVVAPAYTLIGEINEYCKLVIINNDKTQYDSKADLVIRENCGEILEKAINEL